MHYDYLILGAGLSGCAAARLLAQAGARVLVVDRADLAKKDKLCGGLLTPRAQRMMTLLYGDEAESLYEQHHTSMRVLFGAHDHLIDNVRVCGMNRRDLDNFILAKARETGACVLDKTRVEDLDIAGHSCNIRTPEGVHSVTFGALVAADGAASWTRRETQRQCANIQAKQYVPRFVTPTDAKVAPSIEAFVEPSGQPLTGKYNAELMGYCWYIPCGDTANIGCDGAPGSTPAQLREALEVFAREVGVTVEEDAIRGAFIPTGGSVLLQSEVSSDAGTTSVYFLGDAAGLAAPATGEGIYFALKSAHCLARSLTIPGCATYRSLMDGEAATLQRQHSMMGLMFDEDVMEATIALSRVTGIGPKRMVRFALKLFASF